MAPDGGKFYVPIDNFAMRFRNKKKIGFVVPLTKIVHKKIILV